MELKNLSRITVIRDYDKKPYIINVTCEINGKEALVSLEKENGNWLCHYVKTDIRNNWRLADLIRGNFGEFMRWVTTERRKGNYELDDTM